MRKPGPEYRAGRRAILTRRHGRQRAATSSAWDNADQVAFRVFEPRRLGGRNVHTLVFEQGRAVRIDDYAGVSGAVAEFAREFGIRAAIGVPIRILGRTP